jgi:probable addiction module antidote protein
MNPNQISASEASDDLENEATIAAYLNEALASGNSDILLSALADIVKARGMSKIAANAGVQRESLYKSLAEGAKPRFETIQKVAAALGVKLIAVPLHH